MIYEKAKFYRNSQDVFDALGNNMKKLDELGNKINELEMFAEGISFFTYWNEKDINFERFVKTNARKLLTTTKFDVCDVVEIERRTEEGGTYTEHYKVKEVRSYGKYSLLVVQKWN